MSRKIVVNTQYEELREFVERAPEFFDLQGDCIYDSRNRIKVFEFEGRKINVKRFCVPKVFINRIIYKVFRSPKAQRAYEYAFRLKAIGIDTPTPIGYILDSCFGLLGFSYFFSFQEDFTHDIGDFDDHSEEYRVTEGERKILESFGKFTAKLHEGKIYHDDYGRGNILFVMEGEEPRFSLLDINRMTFGEVSFETGCSCFRRLRFTHEMFQIVTEAYANARGFDPKRTLVRTLEYREQHRTRFKPKKLLRK